MKLKERETTVSNKKVTFKGVLLMIELCAFYERVSVKEVIKYINENIDEHLKEKEELQTEYTLMKLIHFQVLRLLACIPNCGKLVDCLIRSY